MQMQHTDRPLLVFGATGGTGVELVRHAVTLGYAVIAFSRNPDKAARTLGDITGHVEVIEGDAGNAADIDRAFAIQPEAVITSLGIYQSRAGSEDLTNATDNIINAMRSQGVQRLVNISSLGVGDSYQQGNFIARLIQRTTLKHTLEDKEKQEQLLRESGLDVTTLRPSRLMNGSGPLDYHTWAGPQPDRKLVWAVNRSHVAEFALRCLDDPASIGKAYVITGIRN